MTLRKITQFVAFLCVIALSASPLLAQGVFATLTGVVSDATGAVVPNAKITLKDAVSGTNRDTVSNGDGYYTFASVPVGSYSLLVSGAGFKDYKADGIALGGGEKINVNVALSVGTADQTVSVDAQNIALATTDSGERSFALSTKELENFTQVGSNAAEYIKIVPGFGVSNGTHNKANYSGQTVGINGNGDSGSQSPLNARLPTMACPSIRWISWRMVHTFPILVAIAILR